MASLRDASTRQCPSRLSFTWNGLTSTLPRRNPLRFTFSAVPSASTRPTLTTTTSTTSWTVFSWGRRAVRRRRHCRCPFTRSSTPRTMSSMHIALNETHSVSVWQARFLSLLILPFMSFFFLHSLHHHHMSHLHLSSSSSSTTCCQGGSLPTLLCTSANQIASSLSVWLALIGLHTACTSVHWPRVCRSICDLSSGLIRHWRQVQITLCLSGRSKSVVL